jgi:hypothetical protein
LIYLPALFEPVCPNTDGGTWCTAAQQSYDMTWAFHRDSVDGKHDVTGIQIDAWDIRRARTEQYDRRDGFSYSEKVKCLPIGKTERYAKPRPLRTRHHNAGSRPSGSGGSSSVRRKGLHLRNTGVVRRGRGRRAWHEAHEFGNNPTATKIVNQFDV